MQIDPSIFKSYDIRGIYPTQINEENFGQVVTAIYAFFQKKTGKEQVTLVVGNDMRISSPALFKVATDTLLSLGANLVDVGLVSTPTFYFAITHYDCDAGIQVTASHNPKEWNGLKFALKLPNGILKIGKPTGMEEIKKMAAEGVTLPKRDNGTMQKIQGVYDEEVKNGLNLWKNPQINKFRIVADPANAMGITYINALEKKVPMDLIRMNFELDGNFPVHQPDPMQPKNLVDLQKRVLEEKADLGLAPDGDGDRLFIIDEKGEVVPPPQIIGILSKELLKQYPGSTIVVDQKYYFTAKIIVEENGGKLELSPTGHAFITAKMGEVNAIFAGEASAHYYYKATGNAESQVCTIIGLLKVLSEEGKPLSVLANECRRSYESGEINFEVTNAQEIFDALKQKYNDGQLSEMDGVTVTYPTWKFNLRASGTEPLIRFNLEAYDKETMEEKQTELINFIKSVAKEKV
jgi:phosphomannomutase